MDRLLNIAKEGNLKHMYKYELDQACFAHDAANSFSKDLSNRTISDKILKYRAYEIAINSKYVGYKSLV